MLVEQGMGLKILEHEDDFDMLMNKELERKLVILLIIEDLINI